MHARLAIGPIELPSLIGGERQRRRQPLQHRVADDVDHGQRRLAGQRRRRFAIQRVLAHVEIERRQFGVHEVRERSDHGLVVERRIGLAHDRALPGELMQHQALQLRHLIERHRLVALVVMQRAEHPADRVAQLAIGLDHVLQDFRADALIVGIVGGAHPQPQDVGARLRDHLLRLDGVAERLRHFAAVLIERETVSQHVVIGRAAAGAAAFQQRGVEPAAVLVRALQIHHAVLAAIDLAMNAGQPREMHRVFQHEGVGRA